MIVNIFVSPNEQHFFYSKEKEVKEIRKEINLILKNDVSLERDVMHKGYVLYSIKHITKNNKFYELHIYYLPKFWDTSLFSIFNNTINKEQENLLISKIENFVDKIKKLDKQHNKKNKSFNKGKNNSIFQEFEYDLFLLKKVFMLLNRMNTEKEKTIVYSDLLVGEINDELNKFNNDKNIQAQTIYVTNDKLFYLINSYLYQKFNKRYFKFLNESKKSQNSVFRELIRVIRNIKKITKYEKETQFLPKDLIKRTLNQKNYIKIFEKNKKLFSFLDLLIRNKVSISKSRHYRKVFFMDKIWELHTEKQLKLYGDIQSVQIEKVFIANKDNLSDNRASRPDLLSENTVIDAKYKGLNSYNNVLQSIDMNDINKLIRDMLFHEKEKGVLVFPMKINPLKENNKEYKIHECDLFNGLQNLSIEIIELKF